MFAHRRPLGAVLDETDKTHQLRADAIVDVAHDPLALAKYRLLVFARTQGRQTLSKRGFPLRHPLLKSPGKFVVFPQCPGVAFHDDPSHYDHDREGCVRQHGKMGLVSKPKQHRAIVVHRGDPSNATGSEQRPCVSVGSTHGALGNMPQ